jgi:L-malate glycosyltransferase
LRAAGVPLVEFPLRSYGDLSLFRAAKVMGRYLREHKIQLLHTFDVPTSIVGISLGRFFGCPVLLSSTRAHRDLVSAQNRRLLRFSDRLIDGMVVNCQALTKHMVEDYGVPLEKIHLCYNGMDFDRFPLAAPRQVRSPLTIGCICVLRKEKGLPTLVEAFASVYTLRPQKDIRLLLVGSGPMLEPLEAQAASLGIRDAVTFQPDTTDVAQWLHKIDIFVLPSLSEALSNSIMEAMLCGCAVIASDVGGTPEIVGSQPGLETPTGLRFPVSDARALAGQIKTLIDDEPLRRRIADSGTHFIRDNFGIEKSVDRLAALYREMLAKKGSATRG